LLRPSGGKLPAVDFDPADVAALLYTGGTTGISRGAMLSHRNLVANAQQNRLWYVDAQPGREVTLGVLPLFHAYGLTLCLTSTTLLAGTLVLLPRFDIDMVLTAIDEHRPTLFPGVPPIYRALVDSPKARRHDLRSIRACVSGSMRLPPETQELFEKVTGGRLVEGYGMTETSPVTHANPLRGTRKAGSIGVPLSGTQCRLVDPADPTRVVPFGEAGEMAVAGPQVFSGYWGDSDPGELFTADGYLLTGDVAVMDDDGFFTLVDRKKELIVAGGFNIYPSEIEDALREHPDIDDACVIGIPDRYRGETVKAFVVAKAQADLTVDDVVEHCTALLTAYKIPKYIEFRESLPQSDVGKVLRRMLRDEELAKQEKK
jgi:long-chain acyl-CoA synthetase